MERRKALHGLLPSRVVRITSAANASPQRTPSPRWLAGERQDRGFHHHGLHPPAPQPGQKSEQFGPRVVPIVPDEARTFGMDSLFRELEDLRIPGQLYEPVDAQMLLSYTEAKEGSDSGGGDHRGWLHGQLHCRRQLIRHTGRARGALLHLLLDVRLPAGGRSDLGGGGHPGRAASSSERPPARPRSRARGCSTRTGTAICWSLLCPSLMAYDPAFAYEVGLVIKDGLRRMYGDNPEDIFYYITLYNENYVQPPMAEGVEAGVLQGLYRWAPAPEGDLPHRATLAFSGTAQMAAREAQQELAEHWGVGVELWSATSFNALREEAMSAERWNRLHPGRGATGSAGDPAACETSGPFVAVTDNMRAVPDQVSRWVPRTYLSLGTDGFGRSDTRAALRRHFETDKEHVVLGVLTALQHDGAFGPGSGRRRNRPLRARPDLPDPWRP